MTKRVLCVQDILRKLPALTHLDLGENLISHIEPDRTFTEVSVLFVCLFACSLVRLFAYSLVRLFACSLVPLSVCSFVRKVK